jgi:hypothetical protein
MVCEPLPRPHRADLGRLAMMALFGAAIGPVVLRLAGSRSHPHRHGPTRHAHPHVSDAHRVHRH